MTGRTHRVIMVGYHQLEADFLLSPVCKTIHILRKNLGDLKYIWMHPIWLDNEDELFGQIYLAKWYFMSKILECPNMEKYWNIIVFPLNPMRGKMNFWAVLRNITSYNQLSFEFNKCTQFTTFGSNFDNPQLRQNEPLFGTHQTQLSVLVCQF